jgi:hypothetical protein
MLHFNVPARSKIVVVWRENDIISVAAFFCILDGFGAFRLVGGGIS